MSASPAISEEMIAALIEATQQALLDDDIEKAQVLSQLAVAASNTFSTALTVVEMRPGGPRRGRPFTT